MKSGNKKRQAGRPASTRKPGRPPLSESEKLSRESVIHRGLEMAALMPLDEISMVRVARELGVTPALIHYYLEGGRDALTSGIINRFYGSVLEDWPDFDQDWRENTVSMASHVYRQLLRYPGIAAHLMLHNRFRVFQMVKPGERDNGAMFLEKFISVVSLAGLDNERTGIFSHLLMEFLLGCAHSTAHYRWPREHVAYLEKKLASLNKEQFPNLVATGYLVGGLDAEQAFENGLGIYLSGIESERA